MPRGVGYGPEAGASESVLAFMRALLGGMEPIGGQQKPTPAPVEKRQVGGVDTTTKPVAPPKPKAPVEASESLVEEPRGSAAPSFDAGQPSIVEDLADRNKKFAPYRL